MKTTLRASVIAAAIAAIPFPAVAAGLGQITVMSALGQPLRAEVDIQATRDELSSLTARLAGQDAFRQAGIDYAPALAGIKFAVERRANGRSVLKVSSDKPVNDPFVDMLVELNWSNGRLVREYTFLLDPPEVQAARAPVAPVAAPKAAAPAPAPVAAPTRAAEPAAPPAAAEKSTYTVKRGDTLAEIAARTKPEDVSIDQMLVALFRGNQDAFEGNMNRLKTGKILTVPDREAAAAVTPAEARREVVAQVADFNAYRARLAQAAKAAEAPPEAVAQQEAAGKITPKVAEKTPAAPASQDQLRVSKGDEAGKTPGAATDKRVATLEEDVVAKERALQDANSRLAELEKNVRELQRLIEMKNQTLADLQAQATARSAAAAPAPVAAVAPAAEPAKAAAPAEPPAPVAEAPKPAVPPPAAEPPKPAAPEKAVEEAPEPGFFDDMDPVTLYGGGAALLALLGFGAFRLTQRRKSEAPMSEPTPSMTPSTGSNSVFGRTGGQSIDTSGSSIQTDFSQSAMTAIDADEGVDPVAEADVYMAYGRDAQAEEILLEALKNEPSRHAIHVKLLEIYAQRKNVKQFEQLATELYGQTHGVGADWEKAAAMGQKLDPANPLYGGKAQPAAPILPEAEPEPEAEDEQTVLLGSSERMKDTWTMPGELGQLASAVEGGGSDVATVVLPETRLGAEDVPAAKGLDLDFDLDLPAVQETPAQEVAMEAPPEVPALDLPADAFETTMAQGEPQGLEFAEEKAPVQPAMPAGTTEIIDLTATQSTDIRGLDFDLDTSVVTPVRNDMAVVDLEKTDVGGSLMDFDFELGDTPARKPEEKPEEKAQEPALNLAGIDLDLGTTSQTSAFSAPFSPGEEERTVILEPVSEEVATKLELARAYEEMGDKEGARELLGEVLKEGSTEQQEKARGLLAQLA